ncbi:hypothetical protein BDV93DRAFT_516050 [Ceratobasidium sp. AG-I]|nr:hypothetical protein BDV93DRAFT_516050 [Ceratobasidium sp. AG-I]
MRKLLPPLIAIAISPSGSQAFQLAKAFWEKKGHAHATGSIGMWDAAQEWGYAYYGPEGNSLMFDFIMENIDSGKLELMWTSWIPINDQSFAVYNVLIPELLVHLVLQDMWSSREDAIGVIKESQGYGNLGNSKLNK